MSQSTLSGAVQISGSDIRANDATQQMVLGTYAETTDGRGFRYAKVGGVATVPGNVLVSAAWSQANQAPVGGLAVNAAVAIGGTTVVTSTSTTNTLNKYAGGYLITDVTPGEGYTYRIASNTATSAAVGCSFTLDDPIVVALSTASKFVVVKHPYDQVIVSPATASTGAPVGVATSIITAAQFGWVQTFGPCAVLAGVATSISLPGVPVTPGASTAGTVIVSTAILPTIGWAMQLFTATEIQMIYLTIH